MPDSWGKGRVDTHSPDLGDHRVLLSFNASPGSIVAENTLLKKQFHINFNCNAKRNRMRYYSMQIITTAVKLWAYIWFLRSKLSETGFAGRRGSKDRTARWCRRAQSWDDPPKGSLAAYRSALGQLLCSYCMPGATLISGTTSHHIPYLPSRSHLRAGLSPGQETRLEKSA